MRGCVPTGRRRPEGDGVFVASRGCVVGTSCGTTLVVCLGRTPISPRRPFGRDSQIGLSAGRVGCFIGGKGGLLPASAGGGFGTAGLRRAKAVSKPLPPAVAV